MHFLRLTSLLVGLLSIALAVPAAADVRVRVEGSSQTLVANVAVPSTGAAVVKDGNPDHSCTGTSAAGALERATAGDWTGPWYDGLGYSVVAVRGETHTAPPGAQSGEYWTFWLNYKPSQVGICGAELQESDQVLLFPDCFGAGCTNPTPLRLIAPASARRGQAFDVTVKEYVISYDQNFNAVATEQPAAGAEVQAGDRSFTTDADGVAHVVPAVSGDLPLRAVKPEHVRSATETVCVTAGDDGLCGTTKPAPPGAPACVTTGDDGLCGTRDRRPAHGRIAGIEEGERFRRGNAPRELAGTVTPDPSGLHAVKLQLRRRNAGRCSYFSGKLERFRETRCGRAFPFSIGDRAEWSYLLPRALAPGRYVLDVIVVDGAFNRDPRARGRNRIVFEVV